MSSGNSDLTSKPKAVICIFAKPPVAGTVKTRLISELGHEGAAALAEAMLQDTVALVRKCSWAQCVIATTEPFTREYFRPEEIWLQGEGNLGERLERILRRGLEQFELAFALGADSPGLPPSWLAQACEKLKTADAVLGDTRDGGFYLLGLKQCPPGILYGIQWSSYNTRLSALMNFNRIGWKLDFARGWLDIDTTEDFRRVHRHMERDLSSAPNTLAFFRALNLSGRQK